MPLEARRSCATLMAFSRWSRHDGDSGGESFAAALVGTWEVRSRGARTWPLLYRHQAQDLSPTADTPCWYVGGGGMRTMLSWSSQPASHL